MKIKVINLYFGRKPDYFDLFLISCANNPSIDFLFFIDFEVPFVPRNVQFIQTTFQEITRLFQAKFDFELCLKSPYKLCDFRPAFGELFSSYLKGYDWWGHCDFDMIFGDLSPVVKLAEHSEYHKILRQGHLTLFKNDLYVNQLYQTDVDILVKLANQKKEGVHQAYPIDGNFMHYEKVFQSESVCAFDEYWGIDRLFYLMNLNVYREPIMADVSPKSAFLKMTNHTNKYGQYFLWQNGKIYCKQSDSKLDSEYLYIHLQKRKMVRNFNLVDLDEGNIIINQFGIFENKKSLFFCLIQKSLPYVPNLSHLYRFYFYRVLKTIKLNFFNFFKRN